VSCRSERTRRDEGRVMSSTGKLVPFGERSNRRQRKAVGREKGEEKGELGNRRVREVNEAEWVKERKGKFMAAVEWAGRAKAYRTQRHVTQAEVGMEFGGYTGERVSQWESGHYFSWDEEALAEYCAMVDRVARRVGWLEPEKKRAGR